MTFFCKILRYKHSCAQKWMKITCCVFTHLNNLCSPSAVLFRFIHARNSSSHFCPSDSFLSSYYDLIKKVTPGRLCMNEPNWQRLNVRTQTADVSKAHQPHEWADATGNVCIITFTSCLTDCRCTHTNTHTHTYTSPCFVPSCLVLAVSKTPV